MTSATTRRGTRAGLLALAIGACTPILQQNRPAALQAAQSRAQFELDCQDVTTSVLSEKTVDGIRFEVTEYTIGARGCGRQTVYLVYCRDPENCNAIAQGDRVQQVP